jgi:prepilin-type N-terminal cleavage/methylation domain-containing protein
MKKAFTIVELLVVMAVIGILITLAVVGIQAIQKAQRETSRINDIRNFQTKLEEFYGKYRFYPRMLSTKTEVKGEIASGWNPGKRICISYPNPPSTVGNSYNCVSTTANGGDGGSANAPFTFIDTIPGAGIYAVNENTVAVYSTFNCNSNFPLQQDGNGIDGGTPNAEQWGIFYKSIGSTPQQYTLFGCTENGKTANWGTLD